MPIFCGACGVENRPNAKFCIGCACRLPGVAPAGMPMTGAGPSSAPEHTPRVDVVASGAGATSFWLHLGLVGLTMIIAFVAWCVYVLQHGTAPWTEIGRRFAPVAQERPAERGGPQARPAESGVPLQSTTLAPAPTPAPAAPNASPAAALGLARPADAPTPDASARPSPARNAKPERRSAETARRQPRREETDAAPVYQPPVSLPRTVPDPGPPIVPGPGPRYESRLEARTPSAAPPATPFSAPSSGDPGPPIAIGPGPRYDYSTPGSRPR